MESFAPKDDTKFVEWLAHFNAAVAENLDHLDLMPADIAPCMRAETDMATALNAIHQAEETLHAARTLLQSARSAGEDTARTLLGQLNSRASLPTELKRELGLPLAKSRRRHRKMGKNPPAFPAPPAPGGLSANIEPNGSHWLRWNSNGNLPGTEYIIEVASGSDLQRTHGQDTTSLPVRALRWTRVAITTQCEFTHRLTQQGQPALYRIRAREAHRESKCSEELYVTPRPTREASGWRDRFQRTLARHTIPLPTRQVSLPVP